MEIGYDYNDVFSQVLICYISVAAGQNGPGIQACPNVAGLVQQLSTYKNNSSYGFFDISYRPVHSSPCTWAPTLRVPAAPNCDSIPKS